MAVSMLCPGCGVLFRAAAEAVGRPARCAQCDVVFVLGATSVPTRRAAEPAPATAENLPPPPPPLPLPSPAEPLVAPKILALAEPESPPVAEAPEAPRSVRRSRPTSRRSSGSPWPIALAIGGGALVLLIGIGIVMAMVIARSERRRPRIAPPVVAVQPAPAPRDVDFPGPPGAQVQPALPGPPLKRLPMTLQNGFANVQASLTNQDAIDRHRPGCRCKAYQVRLEAGKPYVIDLVAPFDAYLRIEEVGGAILRQDDDNGEGLNSRITFVPARTDTYVLIATSFGPAQGNFTLTVRELRNQQRPFGR